MAVYVYDYWANPAEVMREYGIEKIVERRITNKMVYCIGPDEIKEMGTQAIEELVKEINVF